jgi:hypothetical protein
MRPRQPFLQKCADGVKSLNPDARIIAKPGLHQSADLLFLEDNQPVTKDIVRLSFEFGKAIAAIDAPRNHPDEVISPPRPIVPFCERKAASYAQAHGDRSRVPAARRHSFKDARLGRGFVQVKCLRIELGYEVLDLCLFHDVGSRPESLADVEIFEA